MSSRRGTVSVVVMATDVVDFEWNNGCNDPCFHDSALGFLRGSTMFLRMNDDDTKVDIACQIYPDARHKTFCITDVHGLHTGLVSDDDRFLDASMLLQGECPRVLDSMLRTLRPGWVVEVTDRSFDARPLLNQVLASHITLLVDGVTHVHRGARRMAY